MFYANICVTLRKTKQNDKVFSLLKNYNGVGPIIFGNGTQRPTTLGCPSVERRVDRIHPKGLCPTNGACQEPFPHVGRDVRCLGRF